MVGTFKVMRFSSQIVKIKVQPELKQVFNNLNFSFRIGNFVRVGHILFSQIGIEWF